MKYSKRKKLQKRDRNEIVIEFCEALAAIKTSGEAAVFIKDILTEQEIEMLATRLRIARLLLEGLTYQDIEFRLKVGHTTIARISEWLRVSGGGYKMVVSRVKKREPKPKDFYDENDVYKRRFSRYYWPELLIKDIIDSADENNKKKILKSIETVKKKTGLYKEIDKSINDAFRKKT